VSKILLHSGRYFDLLRPKDAEPISAEEIAHALSNICRFTGHTKRFYSVAQHSVLVSLIVPGEHALAGLLHDAAEALLGDVSTPLKALLPDYRDIESSLEEDIFFSFGVDFPLHPSVKAADLRMLATERRDLLPHTTDTWPMLQGVEPLAEHINPVPPGMARDIFMERFNQIIQKRELPTC
jgi:5'-deoxynucleotidase YfbR-like HD superfamily hydrolase